MTRGLQFLLLICVCSLASATQDVKVICSEDVDLPCTAPWDPKVYYTVSWAKLTERGEEVIEMPQEDLSSSKQDYYWKEQNSSLPAPSVKLYSLKIRNTTSCNMGMYRCTLWDPERQRNQSGTVILRVIGCPKEHEETFKNYRAEIVLLLALVVFYLTLIIFTCKFARLQSIFPDVSKPLMERAFLPVTSQNKQSGPDLILQKTEVV
ncbi:PREDICTED: CD83 antigen [Chrysochloris asiatica]|uniref:CD83 antigen n=1 Tax=Chrysochloris asiatica TaxID=185453 RepID=A0A9B0WR31_CHRAS|nr:PREDICTED: CD83 antigen [Chrysochloris asiatica]